MALAEACPVGSQGGGVLSSRSITLLILAFRVLAVFPTGGAEVDRLLNVTFRGLAFLSTGAGGAEVERGLRRRERGRWPLLGEAALGA